ncbi:heparinase II/III family protein [Paenibacillus sp. YN15]|uniref:heparinase II/III domain-containing protein n=1 Tax=Paenibacillus sp. YN15 TaxID=1742774 RepID=UPI0015EB990C|nr:heparinase II/III family protein [Paenibacillus sp. YN15]
MEEPLAPFPRAGDRRPWETVPGSLREKWLCQAEELINFPWPLITAGDYLQFRRNGNRSAFEAVYFQRRSVLTSLVLAECLEGKGRFLEDIINGVWLICEESSWCIPAHLYMSVRGGEGLPQTEEPIIDLFASNTAALLSWIVYLLKEQLDACTVLIAERVRIEVDRRILSPYLARDDFWWMGFHGAKPNNWNPWCNSNCLTAVLLLEKDRKRREKLLQKIADSIDHYLAAQYSDGGCDEGASYWSMAAGSLFDCLELLYLASDGALNIYDKPLIGKLGQYICKMFIDDGYYVNFADGEARLSPDYALIYRYGRRVGDASMKALGIYGLNRRTGTKSVKTGPVFIFRELAAMFTSVSEKEPSAIELYPQEAWLPAVQVMTAREQAGSSKGLYVAVKGGHNDESHNHNDIGQISVYLDGRPVLIDPGVGVYTAQTFSPRRYDIWTMGSSCHNVPIVNGFGQLAGRDYMAQDVKSFLTDSEACIFLDMVKAYPIEADIVYWRRCVTLHRPGDAYIELTDDYSLGSATVPAAWTFMSCCVPQLEEGRIILRHENGPGVSLSYDASMLEASFTPILLDDSKLRGAWGEKIYRLQLVLKVKRKQAVISFTFKALPQ